MNDFVQPEGYLEAAGGLLLVSALGAVFGPPIASLVIRYHGIDSLFAYTACAQVMLAAFAVYRMRRRAPTPDAEHFLFIDALRVAQTVPNVDPLSPATEAAQDHQPGTPADADKRANAPE